MLDSVSCDWGNWHCQQRHCKNTHKKQNHRQQGGILSNLDISFCYIISNRWWLKTQHCGNHLSEMLSHVKIPEAEPAEGTLPSSSGFINRCCNLKGPCYEAWQRLRPISLPPLVPSPQPPSPHPTGPPPPHSCAFALPYAASFFLNDSKWHVSSSWPLNSVN